MAIFTNVATLTYDGGSTTSNTVTGELLEVLSGSKTAVGDSYVPGDRVTYVITLRNTGAVALTGLTVTDNLGAYAFEGQTLYPLSYATDSVLYFVNGVLQAAPAVQAGPPLVITGISIPAGGNVTLVYEANVTPFGPPDADGAIVNEAVVTGGGLSSPVTLTETITPEDRPRLAISKAISPAVVTENGQLTYTFVIQNSGNTPAVATDDVILTDTFNPILDPITVTFNGTLWAEGVNYTYNTATGAFATLPGQITVPAATYARNADGSFTVVPGVATIVVTGTV